MTASVLSAKAAMSDLSIFVTPDLIVFTSRGAQGRAASLRASLLANSRGKDQTRGGGVGGRQLSPECIEGTMPLKAA